MPLLNRVKFLHPQNIPEAEENSIQIVQCSYTEKKTLKTIPGFAA